MKNGILIGLGISVAVLALLFWKGCKENKQTIEDINHWKAYSDSAAASGQRYAQRLDSATIGHEIEKVHWTIDSARMAADLSEKNGAVNQEKTKVGGIVGVYQEAKAHKDTLGQLTACDSLTGELYKAKIAVTDLQTSTTTVVNAYGNEIQQRDSLIDAIVGIGQGLKRANDSLARASTEQFKIAMKLAAQSRKRFSIGPGIGATVIGGKVQPVISIGLQYTLFRF